MLGNITRCAAAQKFDVLVSFQQLSDDWLSEYEVSNRADGIILLGYGDYGRISDRLRRLHEAFAAAIVHDFFNVLSVSIKLQKFIFRTNP